MRLSRLDVIYITRASTTTDRGPSYVSIEAHGEVRLRFDRPYVCSHGLKLLCPLLALGPRKHVLCRHYFHIRQSGASDGIQVLPFQESAADSSGPEVDDLFGCVGDRLVDDYVREIQPAAGLQDSVDLNEAGVLIGC